MTAPLLAVDDLEVQFDTPEGVVHAVNGVSFAVGRGETLAVVGESGSGKSVTMLTLLGLVPQPPARIVGGTASFETSRGTVDLLDKRTHRRGRVRGKEIGYVAQDPQSSLNPTVKVGDQLAEGLTFHRGLSKRAARRESIALLERVGIPDPTARVDAYPHEMSGGMRQRVMIAIAISCSPQLLIADEPTTALDVTVQAQIADLVRELRDEMGLAVVWITHDLGVVAGLADRVAVMYGGRIMEEAAVTEVYRRPLHPYTMGLLAAVPRIGSRAERLASIPGLPPDLIEAPTRCPFADRCPHVFDRCRDELPPTRAVEAGRTLACFYDVELREARRA